MVLRVERVDRALLEPWRLVHNIVIAPAPLSSDEAADRAARYVLDVAFDDDDVVGCSTVRPLDDAGVVVIVRILPEHRRRGLGSAYLDVLLKRVNANGPVRVDTVVLEANHEGLEFAVRRGFVETRRYEWAGAVYLELTLVGSAGR